MGDNQCTALFFLPEQEYIDRIFYLWVLHEYIMDLFIALLSVNDRSDIGYKWRISELPDSVPVS